MGFPAVCLANILDYLALANEPLKRFEKIVKGFATLGQPSLLLLLATPITCDPAAVCHPSLAGNFHKGG